MRLCREYSGGKWVQVPSLTRWSPSSISCADHELVLIANLFCCIDRHRLRG